MSYHDRNTRREIAKQHVDEIKERLVCSNCGIAHWVSPIEFHNFEHDEHPEHRVSILVTNGSSLERIDLEIARSEALCRRCHRYIDGRSESFVAERSKAAKNRTTCKRGHPLIGDNLRMDKNGHRHCKQCNRELTALSLQNTKTKWPSRKIVCHRGHYKLGSNVYVNPRGDRICKQCEIDRGNMPFYSKED